MKRLSTRIERIEESNKQNECLIDRVKEALTFKDRLVLCFLSFSKGEDDYLRQRVEYERLYGTSKDTTFLKIDYPVTPQDIIDLSEFFPDLLEKLCSGQIFFMTERSSFHSDTNDT